MLGTIAIKRINRRKANERTIDKEVRIIQRLKDNKIFPLIFDFKTNDFFLFLYNWKLTRDRFEKILNANFAFRFGIEILLNLKILHNKGFILVYLKENNLTNLSKPVKKRRHFIIVEIIIIQV